MLTIQHHYEIARLGSGDPDRAMTELRQLFPEGKANEMNLAVFSTSGVHGTYFTIEEIEAGFAMDPSSSDYPGDLLTVSVYQPRTVCVSYGNVRVTPDDIEWLKRLRASSWEAFQRIGAPD